MPDINQASIGRALGLTDRTPFISPDGTTKAPDLAALALALHPFVSARGVLPVAAVSEIYAGFSFAGQATGHPMNTADTSVELPFTPPLVTSYEESILTLHFTFDGSGTGQPFLHIGALYGAAHAPVTNIGAPAGFNTIDASIPQTLTLRVGTEFATYDNTTSTWQWRFTIGNHSTGAATSGAFTVTGSIDRDLSQTPQPNQFRKAFGDEDDPYLLPYRPSDSFLTAGELVPLSTPINYTQCSFVLINMSTRSLDHIYGTTLSRFHIILPSRDLFNARTFPNPDIPSRTVYNPRKCLGVTARPDDGGAWGLGGGDWYMGKGYALQFAQANTVMLNTLTHFAVVLGYVLAPYSRGQIDSIWVL